MKLKLSLNDIKNCWRVPNIINALLFSLIISMPLVNGGKGPGAFFAANGILFFSALLLLFQLSKVHPTLASATPCLRGSKGGVKNKSIPFFWWYLLFFGFFIFLTINLFTTVYLQTTLTEWLRLIGYATFFFLVILWAELEKEKHTFFYRQVIGSVVVIGLIESIIVLWQALHGKPLQATFPNSNLVSGYIVVSFIFLLSFFAFSQQRQGCRTRAFLAVMLCVMVAALFVARSRGVFLSFSVVLFLLVVRKRMVLYIGTIVVFVLLIIVVINGTYIDRVLKLAEPFSYRRLAIWQSTVAMIKEHSFFGWGLGNYGLAFPRYNIASMETILRFGKVTRFAHNEFLHLAATAGVPALLFLGSIVLVVFLQGWMVFFKESEGDWIGRAFFLVFVSIIVHSLVDFNLHLPAITYVGILSAGYIISQTSLQESSERLRLKKMMAVGVGIFFLFCLFIVWSFFRAYQYKVEAEKMNSMLFPAHTVVYQYQKALQYNPLDSYYHYELGRFYARIFVDYKRVDFAEKALQEFKAASRLNPEESKIYQKAFYLCAALDLPLAQLQPLYQEAEELEPYYVQLSVDFAFLHMQKGLYRQAKELLKKVIRIEPNYLKAYYYLAEIYEKENHFSAARKLYQHLEYMHDQCLERVVQSDYEKQAVAVDWGNVYYHLGMLYIRVGQYELAEKKLLKSLECKPKNAEFHNALAGAYFQQGKTDLAKKSLEKAIALNPENAHLRKNLTFIK